MPRLLLINGAPASGKSTLARRYVDDHPLALALDVDVVRGMLGGWLITPTDAGRAARRLALAMVRTHLQGGHDVVIPQFLARTEFVEQLEGVAAEVNVDFVEAVLLATGEDLRRRFEQRSAACEHDAHRDAETLLARSGGPATLGKVQERLLIMIGNRPRTRRIETTAGAIDEAYRDLRAALDSAALR